MGLSKAEYAKYQFMIVVMRALMLIVIFLTRDEKIWEQITPQVNDMNQHILFIQGLMKEE